MRKNKNFPHTFLFNTTITLFLISACGGSGSANAKAPFWGKPKPSDFGTKSFLINKIEELENITDTNEVNHLSQSLKDNELCNFTLSEEQLYNPYKHLSLQATSWIITKNISDIDYKLVPTKFSHIKVDYWKKSGDSIERNTSDCFAPNAWETRSPRLELGVHPFVKKYSDCLHGGVPDNQNPIDNCLDGYEIIGGLTHRVRSNTINRHRFRVSWWLKAPETFDEEAQLIRDQLKIPYRIPLEFRSIYSELDASDDYRVRALSFSEESSTELPRNWLIPDEGGQHRNFLPLEGVQLSQDDLSSREKLKEINRANSVANFAGHFAWDRIDRIQKRSFQLPVSRYMDDLVYPLWKKLREGNNLKVHLIFRAKDSDDVYLEEFLLSSSGELNLKKVQQINAYGVTSLGLPHDSFHLDANGLEIYND